MSEQPLRRRKFKSRTTLVINVEAEAKADLIAIAGEYSMGVAIERLIQFYKSRSSAIAPLSLVDSASVRNP